MKRIAPSSRISTRVKAAKKSASSDDGYHLFLDFVRNRFASLQAEGRPMFHTSAAENLWAVYLSNISARKRQHYTCNCCRRFIERYGDLAVIGDDGRLEPVMWSSKLACEDLEGAVIAMEREVRHARVTGVFLSSNADLGERRTGEWKHLHAVNARRFTHSLLSASQAQAAKLEDFKNVSRALADFSLSVLNQAVGLLESDALYRSEKVLGAATWLRDLFNRWRKGADSRTRNHIVWLAVARAPDGFCHPRSSMIGTVLEDLASGLPFDDVARKFAAKMHPLSYQRPQAAPTAGAIAEAERRVEKLGVAASLRRRYATLAEVPKLWTPRESAPAAGVFGHLKSRGTGLVAPVETSEQTITWTKFERTVLPRVQRMRVLAKIHDHFHVFTTAVDASAPPILQWDREDNRNPLAWYVWHGGSAAAAHGVRAGFCEVVGVALMPHMLDVSAIHAHHRAQALLLLSDATETRKSGLALFPEVLKSEFHGIRSVIEAHSQSRNLEDTSGPIAVGLPALHNRRVRVESDGVVANYIIDRWD